MKRLMMALLIAAMILTAGAFALEELPAPGEVVSGFKVKSITPMDVIGATGVLFEHEKSGAELLYLSCEDTNRSFDITFKTPALDDKGKPHVFEHITISGSQKYPDANVFFPIMNQTYSTFVNAMTFHGMTSYPVASLSQDQLMALMDYYLSGTLTPLLYDEPRLVEREAWRYELTDADEPLNIAGTVYSEMQGVRTIQRRAGENNTATIFKDSPVAHVSGGVPEYIAQLTYEDLLEFHGAYYHPSNALITLYGDLDYRRFLDYIDAEYLSGYDKKDIYVERGAVKPYTETLYQVFDAPVEMGMPTENASYIYYSFAANGMGFEDTARFMVLTKYLNSESSPVMKAIREKLPDASVSVSVDIDLPVPVINFLVTGVNESDRDAFVEAVDNAIEQIATEGIPSDELDSAVSLNKLSLMLTGEDPNLGVMASLNIAIGWAYFDSIEFYNINERAIQDITAEGCVALIEKYLRDNTHRAVSVTRPVAGLTEQNAEELKDRLAQIKAAMSPEELEALVAKSNEFIEWGSAGADAAIVAQLANVTVDKLPEELPRHDVEDVTTGGTRFVTCETDVNDIMQMQIMLDASTIPVDMLLDTQVYITLLGQLDTEEHTKEELSPLMTRFLPGFSGSLQATPSLSGEESLCTANISWLGLGEDSNEAGRLLNEIVLTTKLDDTSDILSALTRVNTQTRDSFDMNALDVQITRAMAAIRGDYAFMARVSGIDLYRHIEAMLSDVDGITPRLERARDFILNRHNAIVVCAGSSDAVAAYTNVARELLSRFPDAEREKVDYSQLMFDFNSEAVVNNSNVHMNIIMDTESDYNGKYAPISGLIDDMYMLPRLRNALGAYGAYSQFGNFASYLYTYRDPNLMGTFDIFAQLPDFLRKAEIAQSDVDSYIIGSYKMLNGPVGKLTGALTAITHHLSGLSVDTRIDWMRQAKSTTVQDVRAAADRVEQIIKTGFKSTSGSIASLGDAIGEFESVVKLDEDLSLTDEAA